MEFKRPIVKKDVISAACGRQDLKNLYTELYRIFRSLLTEPVLNDILRAQFAVQSLLLFEITLLNTPRYLIVPPKKSLQDFAGVHERLMISDPLLFRGWCQDQKAHHDEELKEQIVLRAIHHLYMAMVKGEVRFTPALLENLRSSPTVWDLKNTPTFLSGIYHGMGAVIFEIYVIEELLGV